MKIRTDHLVAVGAALQKAQESGVTPQDIKTVRLDGTVVDAAAATAALDAALAAEPPAASTGLVGRTLDRVERRADSVEEKLEKTRLGRRVMELIEKDPERVARDGLVQLTLKDGRTLEIPVVIVSRELSAVLQRVSIGTTAISFTPLVGRFVPAGTAIASGLAALVAHAVGEPALAKSLGGMAARHGALFAVGFVPIISNLTSAMAIVVDRGDLRDLRQPVSVHDIVELGAGANVDVATAPDAAVKA